MLGEARAKELSGRAGQRFESLDAIGKAAAIRHSKDLSDAAVAAFALPDLREQRSWRFPSHWSAQNIVFDDTFGMYAYRTPSGFSVCRVADNQELNFLPVKDVSDIGNGLLLRRFSPHGHYVAASCFTTNGWRWRVWDLNRGGALALQLPGAGYGDFAPDGQSVAVINPDSTLSVRELDSGKELKRFNVDGRLNVVRFSPDGTKLAGLEFGSTTIRIWEAASGLLLESFVAPEMFSTLAWNKDGTLLATGRMDGAIQVWDMRSGRLSAHMDGHEGRVTTLAFSHQGDLLASASWDSTLRLWDVAKGRQLVLYRTQDVELQFSADDRTLAYAIEGETSKLLEVAHSTGYRQLVTHLETPRTWSADFSPDGRLMVVSTRNGVWFWDLMTGKQIGQLPTSECRSAHFQATDGLNVVAATSEGLFRWPLQPEATGGGSFLRAGPPQSLLPRSLYRYSSLDRAGGKILVSQEPGVDPLLVDLRNPTNNLRLPAHPGCQFVALDPAGKWAATGTWKGIGVRVYQASSGQLVKSLPVKGTGVVLFSPDSKWLATADMTALRLWNVGSWEAASPPVPGDQVSEINPVAFSPDGRLLATLHATYELQLLKVPTLEQVATLRLPASAHISCLRFSPNGAQLVAIEWSGPVDIWDLRVTRAELATLNLDWELPPLPASEETPAAGPEVLQLDGSPFSKEELTQTIPARKADASANLIDLTDFYNAPLTESWYSAKGSQNDLSRLRPGVQKLCDIDFDIRGLIQIGAPATNGLFYPNHVLDVPLHRQCRRLHFLHAAILASSARRGDELGSYVFHYVDGRKVELPIVTGKDVADWWSRPQEPDSKFVIAWKGDNPAVRASGGSVRLFKTTWENPFPDVPLRQFDFTSDKPTPGQPFLVAVTVEP